MSERDWFNREYMEFLKLMGKHYRPEYVRFQQELRLSETGKLETIKSNNYHNNLKLKRKGEYLKLKALLTRKNELGLSTTDIERIKNRLNDIDFFIRNNPKFKELSSMLDESTDLSSYTDEELLKYLRESVFLNSLGDKRNLFSESLKSPDSYMTGSPNNNPIEKGKEQTYPDEQTQ